MAKVEADPAPNCWRKVFDLNFLVLSPCVHVRSVASKVTHYAFLCAICCIFIMNSILYLHRSPFRSNTAGACIEYALAMFAFYKLRCNSCDNLQISVTYVAAFAIEGVDLHAQACSTAPDKPHRLIDY